MIAEPWPASCCALSFKSLASQVPCQLPRLTLAGDNTEAACLGSPFNQGSACAAASSSSLACNSAWRCASLLAACSSRSLARWLQATLRASSARLQLLDRLRSAAGSPGPYSHIKTICHAQQMNILYPYLSTQHSRFSMTLMTVQLLQV